MYVTSLKVAFKTLTECEEGMTANAQVYTLLKNIECTNSQIMAAVAAVRVSQTLQSSFTDFANAISKTVLLVFPDTQGKFKKQHVASIEKAERGPRRRPRRRSWRPGRPRRPGRLWWLMTALNVVAFGTWVKAVKRRGQAVQAVLFTNKAAP